MKRIIIALLAFTLVSIVCAHPHPPCGGACNPPAPNHTVIIDLEEIYAQGVEELAIQVAGQDFNVNLSFTGEQTVVISDDEEPIFEFNHNFSVNLNLSNLRIERQTEQYGYTLISNLSINTTKSMYIPIVSRIPRVCVKDAPVTSIEEITNNCNGPNETYFNPCDGSTIGGITCTRLGTQYRIDNLSHSGGLERPPPNKIGYYTIEYINMAKNHRPRYLQAGDIVRLCFESAEPIVEDQLMRLSFLPSKGYPTTAEFQTPGVMAVERVYMYP